MNTTSQLIVQHLLRHPHLALGLYISTTLLIGAGCAGTSQDVILGPTYLIDEITFTGATRFGKNQLLEHVHIGETSWVPLSPDYTFNEALLAVDAERIESFYHSYGYFQVEVTETKAVLDNEEEEIDLFFTIEEGEPTLVRRLAFEWATDAPMTPEARKELEALSTLVQEEPFEVVRINDSIGTIRLEMQRRGHPLAKVNASARVYEGSQLADARFVLDPGPYANVGSVLIQGLNSVPEYMIEREVRFAMGKPYSPALAHQLEQTIKAMRVFRWVDVQPADTVEDGLVQMVVRVSEADPQKIRVGGAVIFEATRWEQDLITQYTHTNLFGHLTRLDLTLVTGWAELPDPFEPDAHGPVLQIRPAFTKKGLVEDHLVWTLTPAFNVDIEDGYQYYSPSNRFGVFRWFSGILRLDLSHNLSFVDFFNTDPLLDPKSSLLGRDFRDPFLLSYVELQAGLFLVDSVLTPSNGAVFEATYDLAGGAFSGDYDFQKFITAVRTYWTPWKPVTLAAQAKTGLIKPYGAAAGAPLNFKFYLGGPNTVRGWGSKRLSPKISDDGGSGIPIGGFTMLQGNLELRLNPFGGLFVVGFVDMGDVQAEELTYAIDEWNYSAGPGLRFDSPLGLFRLDLGFRLNDPGIYPEEPSWSAYFGLGETF